MEIRAGDFVRLRVREAPHRDERDVWWEVVSLTDEGLNAVWWSGGHIAARRFDVSFDAVVDWRKRDHGA